MNYYIVLDGRAVFDEDRASILECIGETTKNKALKEFKKEYKDHDAVLFEYDIDGENLKNGRMISAQV